MEDRERNSITVRRDGGVWAAQFHGPHAEEVRRAFGTDTIPTPWTTETPRETVRDELAARNPGVKVGW